MKYRYLGKSGLLVSRLSLGTMTFGAADWGCDTETSRAIIGRYIDAGGNFIDTADVYSGGNSETIIGEYLSPSIRNNLILASKCYFPAGDGPNRMGSSKKHIRNSVETSLKRLKTDHIDLFYVHGPDPVSPMEESMRELDDLVSQGKILYLGASNWFGWQLAKAAGIAGSRGYEELVAGQYLYNLIHREPEREIIPAAADSGIGIVCYSPLGGGLLTGKYRNMEEPAPGTRLSFRTKVDGPRFWHPAGKKTAEVLETVSRSSGLGMAELAVAWPLKREFVSSVVIGARTVEQLEANLKAGDRDLPDDLWAELEEATRPEEEYLSWFNRVNYARHFAAGEFHDPARELP
jgi:1-deoxyxylulose-5-phosphate synthase